MPHGPRSFNDRSPVRPWTYNNSSSIGIGLCKGCRVIREDSRKPQTNFLYVLPVIIAARTS